MSASFRLTAQRCGFRELHPSFINSLTFVASARVLISAESYSAKDQVFLWDRALE